MYHTAAELFDFSCRLIVRALRKQNKTLVESYRRTLNVLAGFDYTAEIFSTVLLELAETDPKTLEWTLNHFYDLEAHVDLLEDVKGLVTLSLVEQGFIPGQDFSASWTGKIFIKETAQAILMETLPSPYRSLLPKIVQISE
jgi:hypothetical protein